MHIFDLHNVIFVIVCHADTEFVVVLLTKMMILLLRFVEFLTLFLLSVSFVSKNFKDYSLKKQSQYKFTKWTHGHIHMSASTSKNSDLILKQIDEVIEEPFIKFLMLLLPPQLLI
jgi:hypothetical protein